MNGDCTAYWIGRSVGRVIFSTIPFSAHRTGDAGVDMLLNDAVVSKRGVVQHQTVVLFAADATAGSARCRRAWV